MGIAARPVGRGRGGGDERAGRGRAPRARTGVGADVEVSALEVMAVCLNNYPPLYRQFTGSVSFMSRSGDWPQVVPCQDGWIGLCVFTPQQWSDFARMIGREDLSADDRLNSMGGRGRNRELAESVVRPWLEAHTPEEICELGELFRVPVALRRQRPRRARDGPLRRTRRLRRARRGVRRAALALPDVGVTGRRTRRARVGADDEPVRRRWRQRRHRPRPRRHRVRAGPLDGVTVLDLTAFWAGPAATHQLATLGADVIKVESPTRPDGMRFATVQPADRPDWMEYGPTFHGTNPGKRSVTDRLRDSPRDASSCCGWWSTPTWSSRTSRRGCCGNVGLEYDDLVARRSRRHPAAHARVRARRPVARPQRLRADHRAGLGHRAARCTAL